MKVSNQEAKVVDERKNTLLSACQTIGVVVQSSTTSLYSSSSSLSPFFCFFKNILKCIFRVNTHLTFFPSRFVRMKTTKYKMQA